MDLSTLAPGSTHLDAVENSSNPPAATTPQTPLLDSLSKRTSSTPYRREFNKITGSVFASIFLEQLIWRWRKAGRKTFSKFISPCAHPDYRPGSSWHEELGFSRREFEGAVRVLGTKITAGVSLREERKRNILVYWTDKSRRTHWELNAALLEARLRDITENSDALACTLLMKCTDRTLHNKSTTSAVHKDAPTQTTDSANSRGKNNGRQPHKTPDPEALVLDDSDLDSSSSSSALAVKPTLAKEPESAKTRRRKVNNLKSSEKQKPEELAPESGEFKKLKPATVALLAEVAQREDRLDGAALGRPRNAADTAMALRSVLGEPGVHDISIQRAAKKVLGLTGIRTAYGVLRKELENRAHGQPESSPSPASPAQPAATSKVNVNRDGSYVRRGVFVEDGAPRNPQPADDVYAQHGAQIKNGLRWNERDGRYCIQDIRVSPEGICFRLLKGERSPYPLGSSLTENTIHEGLAGLEAERKRRAGADRRREDQEWLFDKETEASA